MAVIILAFCGKGKEERKKNECLVGFSLTCTLHLLCANVYTLRHNSFTTAYFLTYFVQFYVVFVLGLGSGVGYVA